MLYEELRRSIPQLAAVLLSADEDKTKANAAGALSNLVRNSNKLCEDIVDKGAMQVRTSFASIGMNINETIVAEDFFQYYSCQIEIAEMLWKKKKPASLLFGFVLSAMAWHG